MTTTNFKLAQPATSATVAQFLSAHNDNMATLDALPVPSACGSNENMSYIKFNGGLLLMWGSVKYDGNSYVIGPDQYTSGFISKTFTINFPVALTNSNPTIVTSATAELYADVFVMNAAVTSSSYTGRFFAQFNESLHEYTAKTSDKTAHIVVLGRWK